MACGIVGVYFAVCGDDVRDGSIGDDDELERGDRRNGIVVRDCVVLHRLERVPASSADAIFIYGKEGKSKSRDIYVVYIGTGGIRDCLVAVS